MAASGLNYDKALEWMRSFPINEEGDRVRPNTFGLNGFGSFAELFGARGNTYNSNHNGSNRISLDAAAVRADPNIHSFYNPSPPAEFRAPEHHCTNIAKDNGSNDEFLPMLQDKDAKSLYLYRDEAKNVNIIDTMNKLNHIILAVSQLEEHKSFSRLCNELLDKWYQWMEKSFVPVPSKYYNEVDYFWVVVKMLKKLHRRFSPEPLTVINGLAKRYDVKLRSKYSDTKAILQKEYHKYFIIFSKVKEIENFFKVISKYELLESEYIQNHKKIRVILNQLNMITHDLSSIHLSRDHKLSFTIDLQLTKKRFYVYICRLDAHMKRSADRSHALRIASCGQFVEIVIEPMQTPPEPEPKPQEPLPSYQEDSDSDSVSTLNSSEEGWHRFSHFHINNGNNNVVNNNSKNPTENTNQGIISTYAGINEMDDYDSEQGHVFIDEDNSDIEDYGEDTDRDDYDENDYDLIGEDVGDE